MAAAVLLPASLVVFHAERFLLAEADGIHAIGGDAERYEIFFHGGGATVAEAEVVFGRAALVAMTLHGYSYRSEEHTSELQSRLHLVCRPLLGKKKRIANMGCRKP